MLPRSVMNILPMSFGYLSQSCESYLKHKHEDSDGHPTEASALFASKRELGQMHIGRTATTIDACATQSV